MASQIFTALFFTFSSLVTFAYPNVGDKVQWTGEVAQTNGATLQVKIIKEVIGFDKKTSKWTVKYEATMGNETTTRMLEVEDLYSPNHYKEIIGNCPTRGGTLEKITTPAGTYDTCKITMTSEDGTLIERWWGDIPFGVVSKITRDTSASSLKKPDLNSVIAGL